MQYEQFSGQLKDLHVNFIIIIIIIIIPWVTVISKHYENLSFEGTDLDSPIDRVGDTLRLDFDRLRICCLFEKKLDYSPSLQCAESPQGPSRSQA